MNMNCPSIPTAGGIPWKRSSSAATAEPCFPPGMSSTASRCPPAVGSPSSEVGRCRTAYHCPPHWPRRRRDHATSCASLQAEGCRVRTVGGWIRSSRSVRRTGACRVASVSRIPAVPSLVMHCRIIEAPMADRGRYFEAWAYRSLFEEYFRAGRAGCRAKHASQLTALRSTNYRAFRRRRADAPSSPRPVF